MPLASPRTCCRLSAHLSLMRLFAPALSADRTPHGVRILSAGYSVDDTTALKLATLQVKVFLREGAASRNRG